MLELGAERLKKDEIELYYLGISSTSLYYNYRKYIDTKLKILMVELAELYEELEYKDSKFVDNMLIEPYKVFWAAAEPSLQKFYNDIQECLKLPEDFEPQNFPSPESDVDDTEIKDLEAEIQQLQGQYAMELYYLHSLKQNKDYLENIYAPLKNRVDEAWKFTKENSENLKKIAILDKKREEMTESLLKEVQNKHDLLEPKPKENKELIKKMIENKEKSIAEN